MPPHLFPLQTAVQNLSSNARRGVGPSLWGALPLPAPTLRITGVTRDSTGATLASCVVQLFSTVNDRIVNETTSDGSGNYTFIVGGSLTYYIVAYKAGAPDVAGTTANTLVEA